MKVLDQAFGRDWVAYHGDCVEVTKALPDECLDYSVFSPPFSSLYVYSNSTRDLGNSANDDQFYAHFKFLIADLFRAIKPGRLVSFHCCNLPTTITRDGYIGIRDFRGDLIRLFQEAGFIYHSEVCIWKDPVVAQQRTNAIGLLHVQLVKDSAISRQGIPDYLVTMRKPGVNTEPIRGGFYQYNGELPEPDRSYTPVDPETGDVIIPEDQKELLKAWQRNHYSIDVWQRYASPVWFDIKGNDTLNGEKGRRSARHDEDDRHICPLQLTVIKRALQLWSNPGDVVLTPFGGIGSEGYCAVEMGRKAILIELKESYFKELVSNMRIAGKDDVEQLSLLEFVA